MINKMRIVRIIIKPVLAGMVSLLILSIFTLGYNYSGVHIKNPSHATDYKWSSNQLKSNMIEGFAWFRMDEYGFNNVTKTSGSMNVDILLMGSSHLEAVEIDKSENIGFILNQILPRKTTYNIGVSGHDIYRCVKNLKDAFEEYHPTGYIVIETDTAALSSEMVQSVIGAELETIPSYDSGMMFLLQKYCPAIKSLYKQMGNWSKMDSVAEDESTIQYASSYELDLFAKKMRDACPDSIKIIVCYQPSYRIASNGQLEFDENEGEVNAFKDACISNNIFFVDMTEKFSELYHTNHVLAHGFINTAIGVGHLNKHGHRAIAETLAAIIQEDK